MIGGALRGSLFQNSLKQESDDDVELLLSCIYSFSDTILAILT